MSDAKVLLKAFPTQLDIICLQQKKKNCSTRERFDKNSPLSQNSKRSGLANFKEILVFNGTVNSEYRGNICVVLFNLSNLCYVVEIGTHIGNLWLKREMILSLLNAILIGQIMVLVLL